MTSTPDPGPGPAGTAPDVPEAADGGTGGQIDMRSPGWQRPAAATWLVVTEIDGPAGEVFTASTVPGPQPRAFGGDVLLHVGPAPARRRTRRPAWRSGRSWPGRWSPSRPGTCP